MEPLQNQMVPYLLWGVAPWVSKRGTLLIGFKNQSKKGMIILGYNTNIILIR